MTVLTLPYSDQTIPIILVRRRMRSLRVVVKPGGQVVLSAPIWARQEAIESFLRDRAQWIYEKYSLHSKQQRGPKQQNRKRKPLRLPNNPMRPFWTEDLP